MKTLIIEFPREDDRGLPAAKPPSLAERIRAHVAANGLERKPLICPGAKT